MFRHVIIYIYDIYTESINVVLCLGLFKTPASATVPCWIPERRARPKRVAACKPACIDIDTYICTCTHKYDRGEFFRSCCRRGRGLSSNLQTYGSEGHLGNKLLRFLERGVTRESPNSQAGPTANSQAGPTQVGRTSLIPACRGWLR